MPGQFDMDRWDELREIISGKFAEKTRDEWAEVFYGTDACTTPVLTYTCLLYTSDAADE